jgi:type VI secretion system protein ImpL
MKSRLGWLSARWSISFLGTAVLAGLAWVFGPLLPWLEDWPTRLAIVLLLLLVWAVVILLLELQRRGRDATLAAGVTADSAEEAAALRDKLTTALRLLKQARRSRGYLYEQPWYAIIGPPGVGKTTALMNAGLDFPLAAKMGKGAVPGVGGTRLCEWWFTEDAVLIDTAGRYTTQDANVAVDRAGWATFLDLLKRTRPRQPLNGVIVAIAVSDVAQAPAAERLAHARAIRERVKELQTRLGVRIPVYALLTKADLIAGFTQFFDDLDQAQRAQVWGATFPFRTDAAASVTGFSADFRALVERLNLRLFERLQAETDPDKRALIAMFPSQVASLEQPLMEFLWAAFGASPADPAPLLRGVYLSSGTQEGTPIDRLVGTLARSFGLDQRRLANLGPLKGRSYFLRRLLRDVIFGEAMLVSRSPRVARRRAISRTAGYVVAALMVLGTGAVLWRIQSAEQRRIEAAGAALRGYEEAGKRLILDPVDDADLPRLVPWLEHARAMQDEFDRAAAEPSPWWKLGLSQDAKLAAAARAVYRHALERAFLPRLLWRLEAQLRGHLHEPDYLYEATRVYLMLGSAGPLERDLVHEWMNLDWQEWYPGPERQSLREALLHHLDALLMDPLPSVSLDGDLVEQARQVFGHVSFAQRAYSRIHLSALAQRLPPWRPSDALGAAGVGLFVRASGKTLSDGIAGFFTIDGFHAVLLPSLDLAAQSVISESWVLGQPVEFDPNGSQIHTLRHQIIDLYENDYAHAWDGMLSDLNVAPMPSLPRAAQDLYVITSPESPMRALLVSVARQLRLSLPSTTGQTSAAPLQKAAAPQNGYGTAGQLPAVLSKLQKAEPVVSAPGHEIDERYAALLSFIGGGSGAPLDQALKSLIDIQQLLAKLAAAPIGSAPPRFRKGSNPANSLQSEAAQLPQPISRWIASIAASGRALLGGSPRDELAAVFNAPGGPAALCSVAVKNHYPFARNATNDISLEDFSKLFAPGGLIDGFVNTLLRPYVDMDVPTWRLRSADNVRTPVSATALAQFQRAASIRDAFFTSSGTTPSIRFDISPLSVDRDTTQATLDVGGTVVTATRERPHSTQITWPGSGPPSKARFTFDPPPVGQSGVLEEAGPWSLLRLFGHAKLSEVDGSDRDVLTFRSGAREAKFEIRRTAGLDPFAPQLLQDFRCPEVR